MTLRPAGRGNIPHQFLANNANLRNKAILKIMNANKINVILKSCARMTLKTKPKIKVNKTKK
jgi:hypothetical protein